MSPLRERKRKRMDQSTSGEGHGGGLYAAALRPLLFRLDPERAHELSLALLSRIAPAMGHLPGPPDGDGRLEQQLFGLRFPNPIGLAAGFDKDGPGRAPPGRARLRLREIGTITALGAARQPPPRIFRLAADRALINRLGFNNARRRGHGRAAGRLRAPGPAPPLPLGVNIGSSRVVPTSGRRPTTPRASRAWRRRRLRGRSTSARPTPPACATSRGRAPSARSSTPWTRSTAA